MLTIDVGKIKIKWRGTYNAATAYEIDDAVASMMEQQRQHIFVLLTPLAMILQLTTCCTPVGNT